MRNFVPLVAEIVAVGIVKRYVIANTTAVAALFDLVAGSGLALGPRYNLWIR